MMPVSAWIMFAFGCAVLYGGAIWCITIAIKRGNREKR